MVLILAHWIKQQDKIQSLHLLHNLVHHISVNVCKISYFNHNPLERLIIEYNPNEQKKGKI